MKKCWCIILLLATLLLFAGCQNTSIGTPGTDAPGNTETASQTAATQAVTVVEIVDLTLNGDIGTDQALQRFFSDEEYHYYYPSIRSEYVLVRYSNGTEKTAKEALEAGDITIADLDRYDISYYTRARAVEIVDLTENGELLTNDVLEWFYSDGEYDYYFASAKSHYVIVRYSDGTEKAVKEALNTGDITIADLDKFEIDYGKQEKTK